MAERIVIKAILPYPKGLTVNNYWKTGRNGIYVNPLVKRYKGIVWQTLINSFRLGERALRMQLKVYPPDRRIRDLDNVLKAVCDALQFAQVYKNDSQIEQLFVVRKEVIKDGKLEVKLTSLHNC